MHSMPVFTSFLLLRTLSRLQHCHLCSGRSSVWVLFFKGCSAVLQNHANLLNSPARHKAKSATQSGFRGGRRSPIYLKETIGTLSRAEQREFIAGGGRAGRGMVFATIDRLNQETLTPCGYIGLHHSTGGL